MEPPAPPATPPAPVARPRAGRPIARLAACAALSAVVLVHGSAGSWKYFGFMLPQAWSIVVLAAALVAGRRMSRTAMRWLRWSTLPAMILQQLAYMADHQRGDLLVLSAWLVLLIGLELAEDTPARLRYALRRLCRRELLSGDRQAVRRLEREFERSGRRLAIAGAGAVAVALTVTWPRFEELQANWRYWEFGPAVADQVWVTVTGAVIGAWMGRLIGYGLLGRSLRRLEVTLRMVPVHPDEAAGLKPIGDFYFYHSLLANLPAAFLGAWVLTLSLAQGAPAIDRYRPFLGQYLTLLAVATLMGVLAFILPLYSIHRMMRRQKEAVLLAEADGLTPGIEASHRHAAEGGAGDVDAAKQRLETLVERYRQFEATPVWPIDPAIRRRFTVRNLVLLLPFAGYVLGESPVWQDVTDLVRNLG
ncbi:hypothetical protein [Glycomyces tritici]|uniref:DUF4129 domain-containing protein n=1 Tax=Glycomyces tritici TaxID=2665176 RepID=A0ABT7YWV6_9ACTN|nr:hypothetical protein [Glycomyces tritici]MDN3243077.1 hypothetical protein [Glycomyces tritici]